MNFAQKLRRMRRERNLTQDDVADALGITYQAVSKWERGESYPDITMLPAIARYFGVTIDALLTDEDEHSKRIDEIKKEQDRILHSEGSDAAKKYLKTVLREFPDEWELWYHYATYAGNGIRVKSNRPLNDIEGSQEAIRVFQRILRHSIDDELRLSPKLGLANNLKTIGDDQAALEIIQNLPTILSGTRDIMLPWFLAGEERLKAIQAIFLSLAELFWISSRYVAYPDTFIYADDPTGNSFGYSADERIAILEKGIKFLRLLTDENETYQPWRYSYQYRNMAYIAAEDKQYERALEYLEKALEYALINDEIENGTPYQSPLLNRLEQERTYRMSGEDLERFIKTSSVFGKIRDNLMINNMLIKLKQADTKVLGNGQSNL